MTYIPIPADGSHMLNVIIFWLSLFLVLFGLFLTPFWRRMTASEKAAGASEDDIAAGQALAFGGRAMSVFGLVTALVAGSFWVFGSLSDRAEQVESARKVMSSTYGIEVDRAKMDELGYPNERPTADFRVFGSTVLGSEKVTLVWKDGEMILATDVSGRSAVELETTR